MDYLASFQLLPLRLAGNQLIANVVSPDGITNRANLRYYLEIYKPESFKSGNYILHERLRGSEAPPFVQNDIVFSEGCDFDLSSFIWGLLESSAPNATQNTITMQPLATMPIYWKTWVEPYESTTASTEPIQYIMRGKLDENQFAAWHEEFFTTYLQKNRAFLTWQPKDNKIVDRNQPEFLTYLVHHSPCPTKIVARVKIYYTDGTSSDDFTAIQLDEVENYTLYNVPVGFQALGLGSYETTKMIEKYKVWVSNQNLQRLSEERTYWLQNEYEHHVRHIVFLNSIGGWETLRMTGLAMPQLQTSASLMSRQLEANYTPSSEEVFTVSVTGERKLTLHSGYLPDRKWLEYLESLMWSERIYVNTSDGLVPIVLNQNSFDGPSDEEDFGGRVFVFKESKTAIGYSNLPAAPVFETTARPTIWVGLGGYCLTNEFGKRTGYQAFSMLELRYADGLFERVAGVPRKANIPDTEGYILPISSSTCAVTPYINTRIAGTCSFTRNNCAVGSTGTAPEIVIEAGTYGSETSQNEAQARAQAAYNAMNTQTYANEAGVCNLNFQSASISRLSTFSRNNCSGSDFGGQWTIVVPAGAYTSAISQADADNQANVYANSIDTQANANANGTCVAGQLYTKTVTSGKCNVRFRNTGLAGFYFWTGQDTYLTPATNIDVEITPASVPTIQARFNWFGNTGTRTWNYELYRNGVLSGSGSGPITNPASGSSTTSNIVGFPNITTGAAGELMYIKVWWS